MMQDQHQAARARNQQFLVVQFQPSYRWVMQCSPPRLPRDDLVPLPRVTELRAVLGKVGYQFRHGWVIDGRSCRCAQASHRFAADLVPVVVQAPDRNCEFKTTDPGDRWSLVGY